MVIMVCTTCVRVDGAQSFLVFCSVNFTNKHTRAQTYSCLHENCISVYYFVHIILYIQFNTTKINSVQYYYNPRCKLC